MADLDDPLVRQTLNFNHTPMEARVAPRFGNEYEPEMFCSWDGQPWPCDTRTKLNEKLNELGDYDG